MALGGIGTLAEAVGPDPVFQSQAVGVDLREKTLLCESRHELEGGDSQRLALVLRPGAADRPIVFEQFVEPFGGTAEMPLRVDHRRHQELSDSLDRRQLGGSALWIATFTDLRNPSSSYHDRRLLDHFLAVEQSHIGDPETVGRREYVVQLPQRRFPNAPF
ncbi:MAG: hypothetical protein AUI57_01875 [Candidatus Rokubacteria bacterium 13_1_40CM_2_68_8]|nr:MAG: hypothetical protein AUI57_01875 [Candidatus Rokubacteria bacterium 13_1_40CM_2_68_8]